jgi:ribosomal-protein-alanine N-acetyltransferase
VSKEFQHDLVLKSKRLVLRPMELSDFEAWREIRIRCHDWLVKWEPRLPGSPYLGTDLATFKSLLSEATRDKELGTGYRFGIYFEDALRGGINIFNILRGHRQTGTIGYWVDEEVAGRGIVPEAVSLVLKFAFETLLLNRVEIYIVPRNRASLRVVEKLNIPYEGITSKYLMIDGVWEDHARFAITAEDWSKRGEELKSGYVENDQNTY